jgi:hypothetical protein
MIISIELDINNNRILNCDVKYSNDKKAGRGRPRKVAVNIIPVPPILPPVIPPDEQVTVPTNIPAPQPPVEVPKINPKPIPEAPKEPPELSPAQKNHIVELKMILKSIEQRKALRSKVAANAK